MSRMRIPLALLLIGLGKISANLKNKVDMELGICKKFHKSLIMQSAWNIANNKNPFLTQVLKAKYYHNTFFMKAKHRGTQSIF